ncbi:MAG: hypothetical protein ABEI39_03075 [Halobacteriales archaeon]
MLHGEALGPLLGAVALGAVHGIEPGHGWPVAASYALDQANEWAYGLAASLLLGVGHLVSSIAVVLLFFSAKRYFELTRVDEPIHLVGDVFLGGPVSVVAGILLVALGVREYRHGHSHGGPGEAHDHHDHADGGGHAHDHDHAHGRSHGTRGEGFLHRLRTALPFGGNHARSHERPEGANRGLLGIAWFAFLLGFAHEEEFEIIALCAGSVYCLELMLAYAVTVVVGIVGLTMLLIGGYERYEERVEAYTPYLPAVSAGVLLIMGIGFITGLF